MDELTSYLQTVTGDAASGLTDTLLQWVVIPSIIFMVFILTIYIFRTVQHYKVNKAIFEIRDMLREMKAGSTIPRADTETHDTNTAPDETV